MGKETIVVIGGGGAESALVHKYSQSEEVEKIIAIPGNDMMQDLTDKTVETHPKLESGKTVDITSQLDDLNQQNPLAFVDIRDESAIAGGLTDQLEVFGIRSVSPNRTAAKIESDKLYARNFGRSLKLPQPSYEPLNFKSSLPNKSPDNYSEILTNTSIGKRFVKAAGLAQGKGVIGAEGREEIESAINELRREYPEAASNILIESGLEGEEFSAFAMSDGEEYKILGYVQDHKRAYDGDEGPNTGGMGAVSRPLLIEQDEYLQRNIDKYVFGKTFEGLKNQDIEYNGVLFLGGMAVEKIGGKVPYVIEFNARWGDPEAQVLLPGIENDLFELNNRVLSKDLADYEISSDNKVRVAVAGVSKGYPGDYSRAKGKEIKGFEGARSTNGVSLYGAGVKKEGNKYYANGGRLFYVVGEGEDVEEARGIAYEGMSHISIEGDNLHYRTDIGWRDMERLSQNK